MNGAETFGFLFFAVCFIFAHAICQVKLERGLAERELPIGGSLLVVVVIIDTSKDIYCGALTAEASSGVVVYLGDACTFSFEIIL